MKTTPPGLFEAAANAIASRPAALARRSGLRWEMTDRAFLKNLSLPVISVLRCSTDSALRGLTALAESLIMNMFNFYMGQQEPMQGPHPRQARCPRAA